MELCMQPVDALKQKFKMSPEYQQLRSDRQRDSSLAVIKFMADKGLEPVRRCTLRRAFMAGGKDRRSHRGIEPLTDRELQRILDRLVAARCLIRYETVPASMASKGRTKPDVYYDLNIIGVGQDNFSQPKELENYDRIFDRIVLEQDGRKAMLDWIRKELTTNNWKRMSDDVLVRMMDMLGQVVHVTNDHDVVKWADRLPDEESHLREEIKRYIEKNRIGSHEGVMPTNVMG